MIYLLVGGAVEGGAGFNAILPKLLARQKKEIEDNLQVKLSHVSHFKVLTYGPRNRESVSAKGFFAFGVFFSPD
ncbi:unnamed protein product [Sphagnum jensenii]|uniref:Uncharacterized protein n=1 Tax=Sphagnum jensenii TaxID=128206 RepID=A0ABP0VXS1_9BRYO